MRKYNILVFPCGSEIGLEIHRSLRYSTHINMYGGSSVDDHGKFVFNNYIDKIPFIDDPNFIPEIKQIVEKCNIDAIYPTMDKVIWKLKNHEKELGCKVIASPAKTTDICLSKKATYKLLQDVINVPKTYSSTENITFPIFVKPNIGYGSRGVKNINNQTELDVFFKDKEKENYVFPELLTGEEYTIDCFTNYKKELLFCGVRQRRRVSNGISVNTIPVNDEHNEFREIAEKINTVLEFRGAWFVQLKRDKNGKLKLLEIASRLGGSSGLFRAKGINFALLSIFDTFEIPVSIIENDYDIEMDRALDTVYKVNLDFDTTYVDYDDCLFFSGKINHRLVGLLYDFINQGKKVILISKHKGNLQEKLKKHRLETLFDDVIHLNEDDCKYKYMQKNAILIDDSFAERKQAKEHLGIPVFDVENISVLGRLN